MTKDEAKVILQSCRLDTADCDDKRVQEALGMMEGDTELTHWFANELSFDAGFGQKLSEIQPPDGLKEKILAMAPEDVTAEEPIPFPASERKWWQNPKYISAAASILLLITFSAIFLEPQNLQASDDDFDYHDFYQEAAQKSQMLPKLETKSKDLDQLRDYLGSVEAPVPGAMPAKVEPLTEVGATTFIWNGHPVSIIHKREGRDFHLYIIHLNAFGDDDVPPVGTVMHQVNETAMLVWADEAHLYVLTVMGATDALAGVR